MTRDGHIAAYAVDAAGQLHAVALLRDGTAPPDRSWRGGGEVLAEGTSPLSLALTNGRLYWQEAKERGLPWTLHSMPNSGGTIATVAVGTGAAVGDLISEGQSLWFQLETCPQFPNCTSGDLGIWKMPLAGGDLARITAGVGEFAVKGGQLFSKWAPDNAGGIFRTPATGGARQLIDTQALPNRGFSTMGIAADDTTVFYTWRSPTTGGVTIRAAPLQGGASRELLNADVRFQPALSLQVDGEFVYLQLQQEIVRVPAAGGAPVTVASAPAVNAFTHMVVHAGRIYWTSPATQGESCLWRANADGSQTTAIECGLLSFGPLAVDETGVYVTRGLQIVRFAP